MTPEEKWQELRNWVSDIGIEKKNFPSESWLSTYQCGYNDCLKDILRYMRKLEGEQ
jgi:hypothetical protein